MDMRGLNTFIADVRKATSKEDEEERIQKELAKIRQKFKTNPKMKGYDRKKYITKLLYIYMLGYDIEFGHMEAIELLSSNKYSEKHLGYLAVTLLLDESNDILTLVTNSIKKDLVSKQENPQCLALTCIGNVGGKEFAESLAQEVQKLLVASDTRTLVRKKSALTLLRLFRKYPEVLPPDTWSLKVISLLKSKDLGIITSVLSLLIGLVSSDPDSYQESVSGVIDLLSKLVLQKSYNNDYIYYGIPAPWTQVKLLRLLQYFPAPEDKSLLGNVSQVVGRIMQTTARIKDLDKGKTVSRNNAAHSVLFEALNVAIHYDKDESVLTEASSLLSKYLVEKDTNLRYLALDTMSRLAYSQHDEVIATIRKNQDTIFYSLKDKDISIRRRALDLLYSMCDKDSARAIVGELQNYLPISDFAIREELVLKMAILAEKFADDFSWYIDVILSLMAQAGDFVSDDIWYRVVQIVTNSKDKDLQSYISKSSFKAVCLLSAHEAAIKIAGYTLGEFGHLIANNDESTAEKQFNILYSKFDICQNSTKAIIFDCFIKQYNQYNDNNLREKIKGAFSKYRDSYDPEIQQRANEYYMLIESGDPKLFKTLLKTMPAFTERESSVMKRILERQASVTEAGARSMKQKESKEGSNDQQEEEEEDNISIDNKSGVNGGSDLLEFGDNTQSKPTTTTTTGGSLLDDLLGDMTTTTTTSTTNQGPIDDFDFFGGGGSTQQTQKQIQKQTSNNDFDFFGDNNSGNKDDIAMKTAEIAKQKQRERQNTGFGIEDIMSHSKELEMQQEQRKVEEASHQSYQTLCVNSGGVVIENNVLQISMKTEYHGPKGKIVLLYGNKSGSAIGQTRLEIQNIPEIQIEKSVVAPLITPGSQIQQYLSVSCLSSFQAEIPASFYFEFEKKSFKFNFNLPIVLHKFVYPVNIQGSQQFFQKWNSIQKGPPLEKMEIVKLGRQLPDISQVKYLLSNGFGLSILEGIDSNPENLVCAGSFYSNESTVGILVRLESNPKVQAYRLTIKTTDKIVTQALFSSISSQLVK
eukprot:gene5075-8675_t